MITGQADDSATAEAIAREHVRAERAQKSQDVGRIAREFHGAWARSDIGQVKSYLHEQLHEGFWPQLLAVLQRRGWEPTLPKLGEGAVSDHGDGSFDVRFPLDDGEQLLTRWMFDDGQWRIGRLLLPPE